MGESSPLFSNMSSSELEERSRLLAKLYDCREELESRYEKISNLDDSEELGEAQMLYLIITNMQKLEVHYLIEENNEIAEAVVQDKCEEGQSSKVTSS